MLDIAFTHRFATFDMDVRLAAPVGLTALFGRSGSGKTSVIQAVAGLLRPDQGRITLNDRVLMDTGLGINLPPYRRSLGYVFQEGRLFPHLTVRQNLLYGRWFSGRTGANFDDIVDLLAIGPLLPRQPGRLSGGEKQRVAIGRALLSDPQLLLMDEPLAALDDQRRAEIMPYIERLRDQHHIPILYVSHSITEVARLATTLALMQDGRILHYGPTAEMLANAEVAPLLGLREAGSLLSARIEAQDADGLTRLASAGGPLWLPRIAAPVGSALRIRIAAQDVILSRARPEGLSALNILVGSVVDLRLGDGPGALVQMALGDDRLLVRITRRSAEALALQPGLQLYLIIKSVAVAQTDIGQA